MTKMEINSFYQEVIEQLYTRATEKYIKEIVQI